MDSEVIWKSVFSNQPVRQLDNQQDILLKIDSLDSPIFKKIVRLRHFYNYLHIMIGIEKDESLANKYEHSSIFEKDSQNNQLLNNPSKLDESTVNS